MQNRVLLYPTGSYFIKKPLPAVSTVTNFLKTYKQGFNFLEGAKKESVYLNLNSNNFNPLSSQNIYLSKKDSVVLKGQVFKEGLPIKSMVKVLALTSEGILLQTTFTDSEGYFTFYNIPRHLSVVLVAIDKTEVYNATVISSIKTIPYETL